MLKKSIRENLALVHQIIMLLSLFVIEYTLIFKAARWAIDPLGQLCRWPYLIRLSSPEGQVEFLGNRAFCAPVVHAKRI